MTVEKIIANKVIEQMVEEVFPLLLELLEASYKSASCERRLLTKQELAQTLSVSESHIDDLRRRGLISGHRIGVGKKSPIRFSLSEVMQELNRNNHSSQ